VGARVYLVLNSSMKKEERREWSKYFEELDNSRQYEIELEKKIVEEERERIRVEIEKEL
jgi:collagenase-like PrtC family protease